MKRQNVTASLLALAVLLGGVNAQGGKGIEVISSDKDKKVDVFYDGKLFTCYIYPADLEKPVLYPVYSAKGTVVTRGFPRAPRPGERVDHPHHVGIWFNFGDVNGLDFWNNSYAIPAVKKPGYGSIRHQAILETISGQNAGVLRSNADGSVVRAATLGRGAHRGGGYGQSHFACVGRVGVAAAICSAAHDG